MPAWNAPHLALPESAREAMRVPLGLIIQTADLAAHVSKADVLITVGDMVTLTAVEAGYDPNLSIFDYKTKRSEERDFQARLRELGGRWEKVTSPPAVISRALWFLLKGCVDTLAPRTHVRIEVVGEEDLAAIPCIVMAPDGAKLLYGMPDRGMVVVTVNEQSRKEARALLALLVPSSGWKYPLD